MRSAMGRSRKGLRVRIDDLDSRFVNFLIAGVGCRGTAGRRGRYRILGLDVLGRDGVAFCHYYGRCKRSCGLCGLVRCVHDCSSMPAFGGHDGGCDREA